jgi:hypothetical protein
LVHIGSSSGNNDIGDKANNVVNKAIEIASVFKPEIKKVVKVLKITDMKKVAKVAKVR